MIDQNGSNHYTVESSAEYGGDQPIDPWYKVVTLREEVREGRSFNLDEFAIALEQAVADTALKDYGDPAEFFARTCFTRALNEHAGMVLRRLAKQTASTAPVLTLITQFGGGKTHTLASLYHIASAGKKAAELPGVFSDLLRQADVAQAEGPGRRLRCRGFRLRLRCQRRTTLRLSSMTTP